MADCWTHCWKCNAEIKTQKECNYLKTRDGDFNFCPSCYREFIENNSKFILPEKLQQEELSRSLNSAMSDFHEKMMDQGGKIQKSFITKNPSLLKHSGYRYWECDVCQKILQFVKQKQDKN